MTPSKSCPGKDDKRITYMSGARSPAGMFHPHDVLPLLPPALPACQGAAVERQRREPQAPLSSPALPGGPSSRPSISRPLLPLRKLRAGQESACGAAPLRSSSPSHTRLSGTRADRGPCSRLMARGSLSQRRHRPCPREGVPGQGGWNDEGSPPDRNTQNTEASVSGDDTSR